MNGSSGIKHGTTVGAMVLIAAAAGVVAQAGEARATSASGAFRRAEDARQRRLGLEGHREGQRALWAAERAHPRHLDGRPVELHA